MLTKRLVLLSILLSILSIESVRPALGRENQGPPISIGGLESVALAELVETNSPGVAIGIVVGDRLVLATGFGVSNIETGAPVKPDMLFRLGSTTKMFTRMTPKRSTTNRLPAVRIRVLSVTGMPKIDRCAR